MNVESIKRFCSVDDLRPHLKTPFPIDIDGEQWTAATDGKYLVAIKAAFDGEAHKDMPTNVVSVVNEFAKPILGQQSMTRVAVSSLREWAGESIPTVVEDCRFCRGSGSCECSRCQNENADCETCDGDGKIINAPEIKNGFLMGRFCDRVRVAAILDLATSNTLDVELRDGEEAPIVFRGEDWFAVLMPVRIGKYDNLEEVPRWEPAA